MCQSLGLNDPFVVAISPNRPNVKYSLVKLSVRDTTTPFQWLLHDLRSQRTEMPKVIVFCRSIASCVKLYKNFLTQLREESYEPQDAPQSIKYRLFAMFHARVDEQDKEQVLRCFKSEHGICRVVFSTIAFGMGVDIADIRTVIHYGPPSDIEDYVQESGRAGRDNEPSKAVLYLYPGCLVGHIHKSMKMYCKLDSKLCRRKEILKHFPSSNRYIPPDPIHTCCDLCASRCDCTLCGKNSDSEAQCPVPTDETYECTEFHNTERKVSHVQKQALRTKLLELRTSLLMPPPICNQLLYLSPDVSCGLPITVVDTIVANCHIIHSVEDVEEQCSVWHLSHRIMQIIDDTLN